MIPLAGHPAYSIRTGRTADRTVPRHCEHPYNAGVTAPRTWLAALAALLPVPGTAAAIAVGDIYLPELTAGTVVEIGAGGDLATAPRHATGLSQPSAVCQGPGGRLYVAELATGEITDITAGGDMTFVAPFAWGLSGPIELSCTASRILVVEHLRGTIVDATRGGDLSAAAPLAHGVDRPAGLAVDAADGLWLAAASLGVLDVTALGDLAGAMVHAANDLPSAMRSSLAVAAWEGVLAVANEQTDQVLDVTEPGGLSAQPELARVERPIGLRVVAGRLLAVSEAPTADGAGAVLDLSACDGGAPESCAVPFATGVRPFGAAGLAEIRSICGNGVREADEPCDDGNDDDGDACTTRCLRASCGDGFLQVGVEECDDGNTRNDDACRSNCTPARCGDGVVWRGVEECDDDSGGCNPDCQRAVCGDGHVRDGVEQCDDQNDDDHDGCTRRCTFSQEIRVWGCRAAGPIAPAGLALLALALLLARRR
jgi:cysteine-rich repeat protein